MVSPMVDSNLNSLAANSYPNFQFLCFYNIEIKISGWECSGATAITSQIRYNGKMILNHSEIGSLRARPLRENAGTKRMHL